MRVSKVFDVFNGDADGILARHQFRQKYPADTNLITGVKRDIALLVQVSAQSDTAAGDQVFVFDISFDANREAAEALLARGVSITWFDHHRADQLSRHDKLSAHIDTVADTCTSLIVDRTIGGLHRHWAIAAAYGDNLIAVADQLATTAKLPDTSRDQLRQLGEAINYNAYGETVADLHIAPAQLAHALAAYTSPFDFMTKDPIFTSLSMGYAADMAAASALSPMFVDHTLAAFVLPNAAWARRVSGVFANQCARNFPQRAHAIASCNQSGSYAVSIRAPFTDPRAADEVALAFGGGGRKAAAGINDLDPSQFDALIRHMQKVYTRQG